MLRRVAHRILGVTAAAAALASVAPAQADVGDLTFAECLSQNGSGGTCTDLPGSSYDQPNGLAVGPTGTVYSTGFASDSIHRFTPGVAEGLSFAQCVSGAGAPPCLPVGAPQIDGPVALAVSPDGRSLYSANSAQSSFSHFPITADGTLSFDACFSENGSAGACFDTPGSLFSAPSSVAVAPGGGSVYVTALGGHSVNHFDANAQGGLTFSDCHANMFMANPCTGVIVPAFTGPTSVVVGSSGNSAGAIYAAGGNSDSVAHFSAGAGGDLEYVDCVSDGGSAGGCTNLPGSGSFDQPTDLAFSPDGNTLYAVTLSGNSIFRFSVGSGGSLGFAGCDSATGSGGVCDTDRIAPMSALAVSADGRSIYTTSGDFDEVGELSVGTGGDLTYRGCFSADGTAGACTQLTVLQKPSDIQISPSGRSVYVSAFDADALVRFSREAPPATDTTPPSVSVDRKGKAKAGGPIKLTVSCDEPCSAVASGTAKPKGGKRGKPGRPGKPGRLGGASAQAGPGAAATLTLKPKGKLKRSLRKAGRGRASIDVVATDAAGNSASVATTVKLR